MRKSFVTAFMFAAFFGAVVLCSCKGGTQSGDVMQISESDIISLDGTFDDNFLESWEYVILEESPEAAIGSVERIRYDDGLFFVHCNMGNETTIKVFDRSGRYLNNIGRIGRARNEYLNLDHWDVDLYRNEVLVLNGDGFEGTTRIRRYDYQGNFLGVTDLDTIGREFVTVNGFVKCLSDGSFLMNDLMHTFPTHDYFILHPDGHAVALFDLPEYYMLEVPVDFEDILSGNTNRGEKMTMGTMLLCGDSDMSSDTTYLMRRLDNRIYRVFGDKAEPVAQLSFMPTPPDKYKKGFHLSLDDEIIMHKCTADGLVDMKHRVSIGYNQTCYFLDKASCKMYKVDPDTVNASFPAITCQSIMGNDVIGVVIEPFIDEALKRIESKDYDHCYKPDVEEFYRKVRNCQNPVIVIGHYK